MMETPDIVTVALLLSAALALMIAWEVLQRRGPLTPIPDAIRKAFEDGD